MSLFLKNSDLDDYLPSLIDYRVADKVVVSCEGPQCGSCWAFSSAEPIEGIATNGHRINVSTQNFVDCVSLDYGCEGGGWTSALAYAEKTGAKPTTTTPTRPPLPKTVRSTSQATIRPTVYVDIPPNDDALRRALLVLGPVSIALMPRPM